MQNKLVTVTDLSLINDLKGLGIKNFVYPLSFFCVGVLKTFLLDEIKEDNAYLFINRTLDTHSIDKLDVILHNLPSNIKGIIFDDLGIISITKDLNLEKILFLNHFNTNYESVNIYFDYVSEVIIPFDLTKKESLEIILKAKKKVSIMAFGLQSIMYSRRSLVTNHASHFGYDVQNPKDLQVANEKFIAIENEFGTVFYHYPYYDGTSLINDKVKYLFYFPILLPNEKILKVVNNDFSDIETDEGLLNSEMIYKVKEVKR